MHFYIPLRRCIFLHLGIFTPMVSAPNEDQPGGRIDHTRKNPMISGNVTVKKKHFTETISNRDSRFYVPIERRYASFNNIVIPFRSM